MANSKILKNSTYQGNEQGLLIPVGQRRIQH